MSRDRNQPQGEYHYITKLSENSVSLIRGTYTSSSPFSRHRLVKSMAKVWGVSESTIYDIVNRRTWKHV